MSGILVKAVDVDKTFGTFKALQSVSLDVRRGEVCCLIGPSGSGKSTFLRCINMMERVDGGAIFIDGERLGYRRRGDRLYELSDAEIARQRRRTGMVFQRFNLFPHKTALENVMEGPVVVLREPKAEARERARALLDRVGLGDKLDSFPSALSGGQQQRVAIARAMGMRPEIILFDEPTSALDPELVGEVLDVMRGLAESGMTMVVVTHELGFARSVADTVAFLEAGRIGEVGPAAKVLSTPENPRCAAFVRAVHK